VRLKRDEEERIVERRPPGSMLEEAPAMVTDHDALL
jgi:hypothetical protein